MSDNHIDLWGSFSESELKACDEVCGYKKNRKCNVNTWWWNSGVKDEIKKKKYVYKEIKKIPTEETQNEYRRRLKKAAKKAVTRAMKEEAVRKIKEISRNTNNVFSLVKKMKIVSTDVVREMCMRGNDGTLYLNEKDRGNLWKAHMSKIMNEDNDWNQIADADAVEGPIERVMRKKIMDAFKHLKIGKASGPTWWVRFGCSL